MTSTLPVAVDLAVDAPVVAVHGGSRCAAVTVQPQRTRGGIDGALRVHEDGRVVPGSTVQLHGFGTLLLGLGRLAPGWHTVTVAYTGGSRYSAATSAPFPVLVLPADTVTDLVVPEAGVRRGGTVGVTVCTTDAPSPASGVVRLFERARLLAAGRVVAGVGTITLPADLFPGLHLLFAAYAGSYTHRPSETPVVPVVVRNG